MLASRFSPPPRSQVCVTVRPLLGCHCIMRVSVIAPVNDRKTLRIAGILAL
jgi:hypothetical protein